jgi:hypothetical protein
MGSASESTSLPSTPFPPQHVIARTMFIHDLALEPSQSRTQQGRANAIVHPIRQNQFVGSGWPAVTVGQIQLILLQHVDAEQPTFL